MFDQLATQADLPEISVLGLPRLKEMHGSSRSGGVVVSPPCHCWLHPSRGMDIARSDICSCDGPQLVLHLRHSLALAWMLKADILSTSELAATGHASSQSRCPKYVLKPRKKVAGSQRKRQDT
eukprot:3220668-Amphidinium_carterae.1